MLSQNVVYLLSANSLLLSGGLENVVSRVGRKTVLLIARGPSGNQATRQLGNWRATLENYQP